MSPQTEGRIPPRNAMPVLVYRLITLGAIFGSCMVTCPFA
jgi:hypothetical protein